MIQRAGGGLPLRTLLFALLVATGLSAPARADDGVIYQAFNMAFSDVQSSLDHIKGLGYAYVQVSPPAKSADVADWWGRYQPLDLSVIDGPLGDEAALQSLITAAHSKGLKVIIDTVLNHMADVKYNSNTL